MSNNCNAKQLCGNLSGPTYPKPGETYMSGFGSVLQDDQRTNGQQQCYQQPNGSYQLVSYVGQQESNAQSRPNPTSGQQPNGLKHFNSDTWLSDTVNAFNQESLIRKNAGTTGDLVISTRANDQQKQPTKQQSTMVKCVYPKTAEEFDFANAMARAQANLEKHLEENAELVREMAKMCERIQSMNTDIANLQSSNNFLNESNIRLNGENTRLYLENQYLRSRRS